MHQRFVAEVSARRPAIKHAWERKLRSEPITSPLANPDTLVRLMDRTLDELLSELATRVQRPGAPPVRGLRAGCLCGLNPLLAYYRVGATVLATFAGQGARRCPELDSTSAGNCVQETLATFQAIAQDEVRAFCAMCQMEISRRTRAAANDPVDAAAPAAH